MDKFDPEKTVDAVWAVDSETGEEVLIDRLTNEVIMRKVTRTMSAPFDYCAFFAAIEVDPHAKVQITVGQQLGAEVHVRKCSDCMDRVKRVAAAHPDCGDSDGIFMSKN